MNKIFKNENSFLGKIEKLFWKFYQKEAFRFLIAGGLNTLFGVVASMLLRLLFNACGWNPKISFAFLEDIGLVAPNMDIPYLIAFVVLLPVAYTLQVFIAFQTKWSLKRLLVYPVSSIPNFVLQELFIWLFEVVIGLSANISYILSPICSLPIMFFIIRFLVKPMKKSPEKKLKKINTVFLDIDGTLVDSNSKIDPQSVEVIKKLKDKYNFYLVSGRNFEGIMTIYRKLELETPLICNNGALIATKDKKVISTITMDKEVATEIFETYKNDDLSISVYDEFNWYVNKRNSYTNIEEEIVEFHAQEIDSLSDIKNVIKVMIITTVAKTEELYPILKEKYKSLSVKRSKPNFIEISNASIDKGEAIKVIQRQNNLKKPDCMSFGDSIMDLSMFKVCGLNVAVSNACDEVKSQVDIVTDTNDNLGVKKVLEKLL